MALEQHPIPQNISTYEFRLVGDMTLKQFFQLAGGIVIGLIIFRLPLPDLIKYPLVLISVLMGVLMAFIPINGRPFTQWLVAFVRAIYAPTEFHWRLSEEPITPAAAPSLSTATPPTVQPSLQSSPHLALTPSTPPPTAPAVDPNKVASLPPMPILTFSHKNDQPSRPTETGFSKIVETPTPPTTPPTEPASSKPTTPPSQIIPTTPPTEPAPASSLPPQQSQPVPYQTQTPPRPTPPPAPPAQITNLIPPATHPNILTGMVIDSQDKGIDSAIVEIIDSQTGIPARALRTNRTGLFQIATPLSAGDYQIQTEKDSYTFQPISIKVTNTIINPIVIKAQA